MLVEHQLASTGIVVRQQLQASQSVDVNRQELQQVLINLLINAIQAMPNGGELCLRSRNQASSEGQDGVLIEICDTGAGLSTAVSERLFRPFFTTKPEGNGLGLWISLGLMERYGGTLSASNRADLGEDTAGAVFGVWLPCEVAMPD